MPVLAWVCLGRSVRSYFYPSNVTECEIQAGHHYTVHVSARTGVPRSVGSELLDTCIETQYEVQVGHRQVVHVWAHNGCTVARCAR